MILGRNLRYKSSAEHWLTHAKGIEGLHRDILNERNRRRSQGVHYMNPSVTSEHASTQHY